jgi:hypothetical protein
VTLLDVTFGDPEEVLVNWIRGRDLVASSSGAITADVVAPSTSLSGAQRVLQIELAGTPTSTRVLEQATVRYVAWAPKGKRHEVKELASWLRSQLIIFPGDDDIQVVSPLVGRSSPTTDPDTKNLSCWGTVRASLQPHQAAS